MCVCKAGGLRTGLALLSSRGSEGVDLVHDGVLEPAMEYGGRESSRKKGWSDGRPGAGMHSGEKYGRGVAMGHSDRVSIVIIICTAANNDIETNFKRKSVESDWFASWMTFLFSCGNPAPCFNAPENID